jgi:hypothetical protein
MSSMRVAAGQVEARAFRLAKSAPPQSALAAGFFRPDIRNRGNSGSTSEETFRPRRGEARGFFRRSELQLRHSDAEDRALAPEESLRFIAAQERPLEAKLAAARRVV